MTDIKDNAINDELRPSDKLASLLVLMSDKEPPVGATPNLKEIQDWQFDKLDEQRAAEVKTHIARDPECYRMWSDLHAASTFEPEIEKIPTTNIFLTFIKQLWSKPVWLGSGGMVTAMLVIVVVILFPNNKSDWSPLNDPIHAVPEFNWPYLAMSGTRGGTVDYRFKRAFQTGMRNGLQLTTQGQQGWSTAIDILPESLLPCESTANSTQCVQQSELVRKIGVYTAVLYIACLDKDANKESNFDEVFWRSQSDAWDKLGDELQAENIKVFNNKIDKLKTGNQEQQCNTVRDLIYMTY